MSIPAWCANKIVVSKADHTLTVVDDSGHSLFSTLCSVGRNYGNKERRGDCRTPEGTFFIRTIEDCRSWLHDCHDGRGRVRGVYGPYFLRLGGVPHCNSIGIHGTCFNATMGTHTTLGCIRVQNGELVKLMKYIERGTTVEILPEGVPYEPALPVVLPQLGSPVNWDDRARQAYE